MTRARSVHRVSATLFDGEATRLEELELVVEELLEIRVSGEPVTTTMRTPGDDHSLALGWLFAEGLIDSADDVGSVYHCGRTDAPDYGNVIDVTPGAGFAFDLERVEQARRHGSASSACGICGRREIERLLERRKGRAPTSRAIRRSLLLSAPRALERGQALFAHTGGSHAACALDADGSVVAAAEDVGRHNAVDKVVGRTLREGMLRERPPTLLVVSGRASFEIVQKAAVAGFAGVASISAPSSLAVETATAAGLLLASFVRDRRFTIFSHAQQVIEE